jgi:dTDP-4-dehydrorhamnose reductase
MRILITGVTGQVGGALSSRLQDLGTIIAADRTVLDLSQPHTLVVTLDRLAPDLIINPAAYTAVDRAEDEPELAMRVNGDAPGVMAQWTARHGATLIHFSTDYVFSGLGDRAWREEDEPLPLSVYGKSKLAGEDMVRTAGGHHLIIRTSWVYAAKGANFLRTIARRAREVKELRVVADQVGAPTSASLIAIGIQDMLAAGSEAFRNRCAKANGLVHLAAAGETSWYGFAVAIINGLKARNVALAVEEVHPITSEEYPTRAKRPRNSRLDLHRVHDIFEISTLQWSDALGPELDLMAGE